MIPKSRIESLIDQYAYIYVKNISKEFGGKVLFINENDIIGIEDKNGNISYIPRSEVQVITERQ